MLKFNKILLSIVLVLVVSMFISSPASAQARFGIRSTGAIESATDLKLPAGTWVYGTRIYADASSSWMAVYNAATYAAGDNDLSLIIDEIGEATQYESQTNWFKKPIYCSSGVSVQITTGIGIIFYGPEPTE